MVFGQNRAKILIFLKIDEKNGIFPLKRNRPVPLPTIVRQIAFLLNKKCFLAVPNFRFSNSAFLVTNSREFLWFWWILMNSVGFWWILMVSAFKISYERPANWFLVLSDPKIERFWWFLDKIDQKFSFFWKWWKNRDFPFKKKLSRTLGKFCERAKLTYNCPPDRLFA